MIISLDRNYAIINSLRYVDVFTQKLANILIAFCWLLSVVLASLPLLNWGIYKYIPYQYTCAINWEEGRSYLITICVLVFLLPLIVQAVCYLTIFKAAISHTKRSNRIYPTLHSSIQVTGCSITDLPSDSSDISDISQAVRVQHRNVECKAVRTILLIAFTYAICWVPYFTVSFLRLSSSPVTSYSDSAAIFSVFLTGVVNPVIYVFMNRLMRFEINKLLCGHGNRDRSRKSSTDADNDDFYSTTVMSGSIPKTTSSSSSSCQTRLGTKNRRIEMKTIKEEEVELEHVFPYKPEMNIEVKQDEIQTDINNKPIKTELFLNPSDLHLQRKRVRTKRERLLSIREDVTLQCPSSSDRQSHCTTSSLSPSKRHYLQDLDQAWNPSLESQKHRRSRSNTTGVNKDETFSRRRRDTGSFLYFENTDIHRNSSRRSNRRQHRRFSVDGNLCRFENFPRRPNTSNQSQKERRQTIDISVTEPESEPCTLVAPPTSASQHFCERTADSDPELERKSRSNHVILESSTDKGVTCVISISPH